MKPSSINAASPSTSQPGSATQSPSEPRFADRVREQALHFSQRGSEPRPRAARPLQGSDLARITNYVNATRKEGDDTARSIAGKWPSWKQVKLTLASEAQTALRAEPVRSLARRASGDSLDSDATPRIRNSELALSRSQNKGPDPTKAQEGLASRLYRAFRVIVRSYAYSIANWVQQVAASTNQPTIAIGAKGKQIALTASDRLVQLFSQALQTLVNALGYGLNHPTTDPRTRPQ